MRRFSRQEPGPVDLVTSAVAADFPHVVVVVLRLQSVSPFTTCHFRTRRYSGSAAVLKEEATKAAFSSPPHRQNDFTCGLYVRSTDHRTA